MPPGAHAQLTAGTAIIDDMRPRLAVLLPLLGGCSFIYNPDHITRDIDAQVADVEIVTDVDPTMLQLVDLFPKKVNEGAGTGNSKPQTFVISGHQIAADAVVSISPDPQDAATVHLMQQMVATDANFIAFTISVDDDGVQNDNTERPVIVTVTQSGGTITQSFDATKLAVHHLDSLTTQITSAPRALYSMIDVKTTLPFAQSATSGPISLRAVGPIHVTGKVNADATSTTPGPGGCAGGDKGVSGATTNGLGWPCIGHGLSSGAGLLSNVGGGGAGFVTGGAQGGGSGGGQGGGIAGNIYIEAFSTNVPSGGGGGGLAQLLGSAQAGGCGGGILELTAGGDLTLDGGASANGGDGVSGGGGDGGGGAGGVVLLRSAATVAVTGNVTVTNGHGGSGGSAAGGDGSVGRIRVDGAKGSFPTAGYNAPMFVDPPAMTHEKTPNLVLHGVANDATAMMTVFDATGHPTNGPSPIAFGNDPMLTYPVTLTSGYNRVCVVVKDGNLTNSEAGNCTDIAFLPGP